MSWGIKLFAEKKRKSSNKWEMIGKTNILDEVKHILITDTMECAGGTQDIEENTFDSVDISELSQGILDYYDGKIDEYHLVKVYSVNAMHKLCDSLINNYQATMMMCYRALGFNCKVNFYTEPVLDIETDKYQPYSADLNPAYNPLTFPVNKDMLLQLNEESVGYEKAIKWRGILAAINGLAREDWDLDRDAEIRLVFVRSC